MSTSLIFELGHMAVNIIMFGFGNGKNIVQTNYVADQLKKLCCDFSLVCFAKVNQPLSRSQNCSQCLLENVSQNSTVHFKCIYFSVK